MGVPVLSAKFFLSGIIPVLPLLFRGLASVGVDGIVVGITGVARGGAAGLASVSRVLSRGLSRKVRFEGVEDDGKGGVPNDGTSAGDAVSGATVAGEAAGGAGISPFSNESKEIGAGAETSGVAGTGGMSVKPCPKHDTAEIPPKTSPEKNTIKFPLFIV
jgi:hypothetical protein